MSSRVIYSSRPDAYKSVCPDPEIYIGPKSMIPEMKKHLSCPMVAVEDVTKTPTWLWLNEAIRDGTRVVYDRVSRYYKVDSDKARRLSRLAEIAHVSLVDLVPFCEHRKFLYMPWRYVSRSVLGYAHFYAFSGDHGEEVGGRIVNSLDEDLLCNKISDHVVACEPRSMAGTKKIQINFTAAEHSDYLSKREAVFSKYKTPQPILTRLADFSHSFATRRAAVLDLLDKGDAVICNMASYAKHYQQHKPGVIVGTYAKPPKGLFDCPKVVFAEPPIVLSYKRIDIESQLSAGADVVEIVGDTKVDSFLCGRVGEELAGIDRFMEKLRASL